MPFTLGSLFSGIGGFELAAKRLGIDPVWASEILPACVSVTKRHFPNIKHLGDITKLNGRDLDPVDIITLGSPCQDLSLAGKREGINGSRSGLFFEAIRIVKEMREKTNGRYPACIIWENVFGAFSSSKGQDFKTVLQEIVSITDSGVSIPRPAAGSDSGNAVWGGAGAIVGDSWSLAWRTLDAQYWGVPHRRRRIFLVADFGGGRAGEILFKPESVSGNSAEGREEGKKSALNATQCFEETGQCLRAEGENRPSRPSDTTVIPINTQIAARSNNEKRSGLGVGHDGDPAFTLQESHHHAVCYDARGNGNGKIVNTLTDNQNRITNYTTVVVCRTAQTKSNGWGVSEDKAYTLDGTTGQAVAFSFQRIGEYKESNVTKTMAERDYKSPTDLIVYQDTVGSLCARDYKGIGNQYVNENKCVISRDFIVRRLTPTECERLQGFPDGWTSCGHDGRPVSDRQRYKMLGNSLALPCAERVLAGVHEQLMELPV